MGRKKVAAVVPETAGEARKRLVSELRLFNHKEAADLLEADGRAGELEPEYGVRMHGARPSSRTSGTGPTRNTGHGSSLIPTGDWTRPRTSMQTRTLPECGA